MVKIGEIFNFKEKMNIPQNPEVVSIFIDAEYVIQSMKTLKGKPNTERIKITDILWKEIVDYLLEGRTLKEILYYSSELDKGENPITYNKQVSYLRSLQNQIPDILLRMGKMQKVKVKMEETWLENSDNREKNKNKFIYTWVQKGIDVKMSVDLIVKAVKNEYETAIILAGDSDFEEVIREIRNFGKKVELVTFDRFDSGIIASFSKSATTHKILTYKIGKNLFWKTPH